MAKTTRSAEPKAELATDAAGLSNAEAGSRLAKFGPNLFRDHQERPLFVQFLARFKNPLVILLLVASAISAFTGEITNFVIISVMVLFSVTLDFIQEHRAGKAAESLRHSVSVRARVIRDGKSIEVPVTEVVPGDLALLSAGDMVPADGLVLEANDLFVQQGLLTGESYPVEKHPGAPAANASDMQEATNAVFMGTTIISGSARMRVVKTGTGTAIGAIADSLNRQPPATAFEVGTHRFGLLIMRLTVLLVLFVLLVNALQHKPWLESFLFAVALAVGLTPELLPMVVSVTLSRGALHMAKKRVIVKRLASITDLGSMDVLCTDKTGTLTEAKIRLEQHVDPQGKPSERVLELAYLNSFFETGLKSPLDEAILAHEHIDVSAWKKIDEVPFDFERRRVSVLLDKGDTRMLVVKGAAEEILGLCTVYEEPKSGVNTANLSSAIKPFPEGEDWVRGNNNNEKAYLNPPHPNLLPEGEGAYVLKSIGLGSEVTPPLDKAALESIHRSTSPSKRKGSGYWVSPGAKFHWIIPMPSSAMNRNWCSRVLRASSIRPRRAPVPHSLPLRTAE